jgi:hypothetical protein
VVVLDDEDGAPWNVMRPAPDVVVLVTRFLGNAERLPHVTRNFTAYFNTLAPQTASGGRLTTEQAEYVVTTVVEVMRRMTAERNGDDAIEVEGDLQQLGAWLYRVGLRSRELQTIGHALVRSVRDGLDPSVWTTGVGSAWAAAQTWLVTMLLSGAQREAVLVDRARQVSQPPDRPGPSGLRGLRARWGKVARSPKRREEGNSFELS